MNNTLKILSIPAERFPTHESFLGEVYSKEDKLFKTVFLFKTDQLSTRKTRWNKSRVYLFRRYSGFKIINSINTYLSIDLRYLYLIPYIIFKEHIDVIQVRDLTFPLVISLFFKIFGKKVVYQKSHPHEYHKINKAKHDSKNMKYPKFLYRSRVIENILLHKMLCFCDAVFPITCYMGEELSKKHNISEEKIYPFGMGFNFDKHVYKKEVKDSSTTRFVYIGTLAKERGFDVLLSGISKYIRICKYNNISFDFIGGEKEEIESMKKLGKSIGINKYLNFRGRLERHQVYKLLPKYHIGVSFIGNSKQFHDASPTKLVEYLAFGLPFIATDSVLMHHDIKNATGAGIITKNLSDDVCEKLDQCIKNYPALLKNAENGPDYIRKNYNYNKMKTKLAEIYNEILGTDL